MKGKGSDSSSDLFEQTTFNRYYCLQLSIKKKGKGKIINSNSGVTRACSVSPQDFIERFSPSAAFSVLDAPQLFHLVVNLNNTLTYSIIVQSE